MKLLLTVNVECEPSTTFNFHHVCPISRPWCWLGECVLLVVVHVTTHVQEFVTREC